MTILFILLFWGLVLLAFMRPGPMLLYVFFGSMSFGSFAVLPTQVTGGLTLTPTPIVSLFIIIRTLTATGAIGRLLALACLPNRMVLLFAFWIVSVYATLFMPRFFAGEVDVVPVRGTALSLTSPLVPSAQNISQLCYMTISVLTVFAFADLLRHPAMRRSAIGALVFGGAMVVATGLLDFASQYLPLGSLLEPLRTASYSLATEVVVLGGKRVVGLMPEASAYGGLALPFLMMLYFLRRTIENPKVRDVVVPAILVALLGLVYLAKSSGAYVGLALFVMVAAGEWLWRFMQKRRHSRHGLWSEFWVVYGLCLAVLVVAMLKPDLFTPVVDLMNRMIFEKASSASYDERGVWRATAWNALWATYGAGIGIGSTRSSSEIAGVFAATGLVGGALYYAFVAQTLLRQAREGDVVGHAVTNAVRLAFLPTLVLGYFVGSADFGAFNGFMYGLMTATAFAKGSSGLPYRPVGAQRRLDVSARAPALSFRLASSTLPARP